jgi:hypothetical protein
MQTASGNPTGLGLDLKTFHSEMIGNGDMGPALRSEMADRP